MYVYQCMRSPVITVTPDTPIGEAQMMMRENKIRRLVVVDGNGNPVGILRENRLREVIASLASSPFIKDSKQSLTMVPVGEVMLEDVKTISPNVMVAQASRVGVGQREGELLVIDDSGKLVGILTFTDMIRLLVKGLFQLGKNEVAFYFTEEIKQGVWPDIIRVLNAHQVEIMSLMNVLPPNDPKKELSIYLKAPDIDAVVSALQDKGYAFTVVRG